MFMFYALAAALVVGWLRGGRRSGPAATPSPGGPAPPQTPAIAKP